MSYDPALETYKAHVESEFADWAPHALCVDVPTREFFAESAVAQRAVATAVCSRCPVRLACLEYALVMETGGRTSRAKIARAGVWGGLTELERRVLMTQLRKALPTWAAQRRVVQRWLTTCVTPITRQRQLFADEAAG